MHTMTLMFFLVGNFKLFFVDSSDKTTNFADSVLHCSLKTLSLDFHIVANPQSLDFSSMALCT